MRDLLTDFNFFLQNYGTRLNLYRGKVKLNEHLFIILTIKEVSSNFWTVQRILKIQKAKLVRISPGVRRTEREDQVTHSDLGHGVRFHLE